MDKNEIKQIVRELLDEEYVGWKAPVLPGNAQQGDYLVAKEDFIDPPLDISNKTEWYHPETNPEPAPEDVVKSVNDILPDSEGNVELKASDIEATNTQSIQANLERIDEAVEGVIDDIADLEANKQQKLIAGTNITLTPGVEGTTISASGGSGGGCAWGEITGTLANQTDLNNALDDILSRLDTLEDTAEDHEERITALENPPTPGRTINLMNKSGSTLTVQGNYIYVKLNDAVANTCTNRTIDYEFTMENATDVTYIRTQLPLVIEAVEDASYHRRMIGGSLTPPISFLEGYSGQIWVGFEKGWQLDGVTVDINNVGLTYNNGVLIAKTLDTETLLTTVTFTKFEATETNE